MIKKQNKTAYLQPFFPAEQGLAFCGLHANMVPFLRKCFFYGRMPFVMPTLVASYDTQGYGTPILTRAYNHRDQYTGTHFADFGRMIG